MYYHTKYKTVQCSECGGDVLKRRVGRVVCSPCHAARRAARNADPEQIAKRREYQRARTERMAASPRIDEINHKKKIRSYARAEARQRGVPVEIVLAEMGA